MKMDLNCRVCLQVQDIMVDLFEEVDQFQTDLASLLEDCGGMVVKQDDSFPKYLCQQCTQELLLVAEFRKKCRTATKLLLEMQLTNNDEELLYQTDEALKTTECTQAKDSQTNLIVISDSSDSDSIENSRPDHEDVLVPSTIESYSKSDAFHINVVFDNESVKNSKNSLPNESAVNSNKDFQLILHNNKQTNPASYISEETFINSDAMTTDSNSYDKAYNSNDISNEFADSIIEELVNEENELESDHIGVEYSATPPQTTENYKFACEACGACFVKSINLRRHMEIGHNEKLEFFCENCHRTFETENDFKRHEEICCQEIKTKNTQNLLKASKSNKKRSQTFNKYSCDYCGKCLQSLFSLRMHVRTHTGERPFSCDACQSQFKTQAALTAHQKRHSGNADLICEVCQKRFYDISNLKTHRRIHTGHKPHTCNICNKSFTRVYLLQLHMRTHTGERPFKCEHCPKTFAQNSDLKYHLATHSGDRKYSCTTCPKKFIRKSQLEVHMQKHIMPSTQKIMELNGTETIKDDEEFFTNVYNELDLCDLNVIDEGESYD